MTKGVKITKGPDLETIVNQENSNLDSKGEEKVNKLDSALLNIPNSVDRPGGTRNKFFQKLIESDNIQIAKGYIRVSTEDQVDKHSLPAQEEKIKAHCQYKKLRLVQIYRDEGISGKNYNNRPSLLQMLKELSDHEKLVIPYISRLARNLRQLLEIIDFVHRRKSSIMFLDIDVDTGTANGKLMINIFGALAEHESEVISERVKTTMRNMKSKGTLRSKPRFGYRLVERKKEEGGNIIVEDEEEQGVIEYIRQLKSEKPHITLTEICEKLTAKSVTIRKCKKLYPTTISRIIKDNDIK